MTKIDPQKMMAQLGQMQKEMEVAQEELSRRGVVWKDPIKPAGGGGRIVFFADLDGNLLHLVDRPSTSALA